MPQIKLEIRTEEIDEILGKTPKQDSPVGRFLDISHRAYSINRKLVF
ncbi:MAG: hypothetical protein GXO88_14900 [Chlorobi bacterium]|nr:hypothetical protein [Chlorobiota bacterium]